MGLPLGILVLLFAASTAAAKPPRTGFERNVTAGLSAPKKAGAPRAVRARAVEGRKVLRLPRSRRPQWIQHRYRPQASRLAVTLSYRRVRRGRQIVLSLPANEIQLADTGTGKLLLMRPLKPARIIARVKGPGQWNRLKIIVDSRRNRMRFVPNSRTRTRWQKTPLRREAGLRLGAPSMRNGPVFYDAVNISTDAAQRPGGIPSPSPSPAGTPSPSPVGAPGTGAGPLPPAPPRNTAVGTAGSRWTINGALTYPGTAAEGTLQVIRAANAIYDDANPATRGYWAYPDTGVWDPERNVREFLAQLPVWRSYGVNAIDVSMMGGRPYEFGSPLSEILGDADDQPQNAIGFTPQGQLLPAWKGRAERVIEAADELNLVVILTVLYWGQTHRLADVSYETAAITNTAWWLREKGYTNVLLELSNESHHNVVHTYLGVARAAHPDLLVGIGMSPVRRFDGFDPSWWRDADWTCLHGNGREDADFYADIAQARSLTAMPLCVNEDSEWRITQERFNTLNQLGIGNGYYDQDGFQSPPINWSINSAYKQSFFNKVKAVTGGAAVSG